MRRPVSWTAAAAVIVIFLLTVGAVRSQFVANAPTDVYVLGPVGVVPPDIVRLSMVNAGPIPCEIEWKMSAYNFDPRLTTANAEAIIGDTRTVVSAEATYQSANSGFYGAIDCLNVPREPPTFLDVNCRPTITAQVAVKPSTAADGSAPGARDCVISTTLEVMEDAKTKLIVQPPPPFQVKPTPGDPPR